MPSSTKWRIYITAYTQGPYICLTDAVMRTSNGGANQCTGGTASASSQYDSSYSAANAFDGNSGTHWLTAGVPAWLQYEFTVAKDITEFAISSTFGPAYTPKDFQLQYWDGTAWVTTITRTGEPAFASETRTYNAIPKMEWRLLCTAGDFQFIEVGNLRMYSTIGGADICTGGAASADTVYDTSQYQASKAFDNLDTTKWVGSVGAGYPHYLRYGFATPQEVVQYAVQAPSTSGAYPPSSFKLQYSDGANGWVDADSRSSVPSWTASENRIYTVGSAGALTRPQVFVCT